MATKKPGSGKTPGGGDVPSNVKGALDKAKETATKGRSEEAGGSESPTTPTPTPAKPDFENPKFDDRKLTDYALNPEHPVGKHKAKVIESATGLGRDDAAAVKQQILDQVKGGETITGKVDEHGSRFNKDVTLTGPEGTITVRTAWIVDATTGETRLVTVSFPN
ncbi:DUF6883 domain-containing protein [Actinosynnema sp. CS-041913]|uniref:DUF6883 domain-containing protein n=1 Tax=Actinosynnema sp. CS-041913 TaxID=3239917 RepID=UPI003D900F62